MKILQVLSSFKTNNSLSTELSNAIIEKLRVKDSQTTVVTRNLAEATFPHLTESIVTSLYKRNEGAETELPDSIKLADQLINELLEADTIVIGVPMYNFTISSSLKSWIDFVARAGETFRYTPEGPIGLVQNKKVYLAISSGNVYTSERMKKFDFTESYLKTVLGFLGMIEVECFRVEGLGIPEIKDSALKTAIENVEGYCF